MSLAGFQGALGRAVRARAAVPLDELTLSEAERERIGQLIASQGFRATMAVQRSWCESRAALGASLTLSILPLEQRREFVGEWIAQGGGTNSFFAAEADAFLAFIAERLPPHSHALSICRLERAVLRAEEQASLFVSPDSKSLRDADCVLSRGDHATLIALFAEPDELLMALDNRQALPPIAGEYLLFVAPGLPGLVRPASPAEIVLWQTLTTPATVAAVLEQGHEQATIETLANSGVLQFRDVRR